MGRLPDKIMRGCCLGADFPYLMNNLCTCAGIRRQREREKERDAQAIVCILILGLHPAKDGM